MYKICSLTTWNKIRNKNKWKFVFYKYMEIEQDTTK